MDSTLNNFIKSSLNWLIPHKCIRCRTKLPTNHHPSCEDCYIQLPFHAQSCPQCGRAFAADALECGRCLTSPPPFDSVFCPFKYESPISDNIIKLKYYNHPEYARILGRLLATEIRAYGLKMPEALIPAPLHISRLNARGYNQSTLLAESLSQEFNIPVKRDVIKKTKKTLPQAQLSLSKRELNLKGVFKIDNHVPLKSVAIVDDVVTTGSTVKEMSKILKRNGVDYIQVWGIAHTV